MVDTAGETARERALERVRAKRATMTNLAIYLIVNTFLWILWALTRDEGGSQSVGPWPIWVTLGWGIGLAVQAWNAYGRKPISEADIEREMRKGA